MADRIRVELLTSHSANWQDISRYVTAEWGGEALHGGSGVHPDGSASIALRLVDKRTDKTTHHWVNLVLTSTTQPRVKLAFVVGDTEPPTYKTIFEGWVDQNACVYEGDCVVGFAVESLMSRLGRVDVSPAAGGEAETTTYSGKVDALLRSALRKAGCTLVDGDVVVKDWSHGTAQTATDWAHLKREWDAKSPGVTEYGLGDLVPFPSSGPQEIRGFTLKNGRLYRVQGLDKLSLVEVVDAIGKAYTTTGYRLFRFLAEGGKECLLVVEAELRPTWARWSRTSAAASGISTAWATAGNVAALFAAAANPIAGAAVAVSSLGISSLIREAGTQRGITQSGDDFFSVTGFRLLDMGDGTNGAAGVGRTINRAFTGITNAAFVYTPGDSVCVGDGTPAAQSSSPGEVFYCRWSEADQRYTLIRAYWATGAGQWRSGVIQGEAGNIHSGPPRSMAVVTTGAPGALFRVVFVTTERGWALHTQLPGGGPFHVRFKQATVSAGRFIGGLAASSGGNYYAIFGYAGLAKWIIARAGAVETPLEQDTSADGVLVAAASWPVTIKGNDRLAVLLQRAGTDGRQHLYAGTYYADGTTPRLTSYCTNPLPDGGGGDWRAPLVWDDQNLAAPAVRFTAYCQRDDDDRVLTDGYTSGLYAQAYIHHDFKRERVSVAELVRECCRSFWLYPNIATLTSVSIQSRHFWTPVARGTIDGSLDQRPSEVTGTIYYDGAVATVGGEVIEVGSRAVGRNVFTLMGRWLTPAWARRQTAAVVALYPRRDAVKYPNGRRTFRVHARGYRTAGGAFAPLAHDDLHHRLALNLFSFGQVQAIVESLGFSRASRLHSVEAVEYYVSPTSGKGDGVDWDTDQPDAIAVAGQFAVMGAADIDTTETDPTGPIYDWVVDAYPIAPPAGILNPRIYCHRVWLPYGLVLRAYGFGLRAAGLKAHGALYLSVWTDVDGWPGERYNDSRALALMSGRSVGWNLQRPNVDGKTECALPPGHCWVVLCLDCNPSLGIVDPPLDWWHGGFCGRGFAGYRLMPGGVGGFVSGTLPVGEFTRASDTPAIYLT